MKKIIALMVLISLTAGACQKQANKTNTIASTSGSTAQRNYEIYNGLIWSGQPKICNNNLSCLAQASETCQPAKGDFSGSYLSALGGNPITQKYELGIQGEYQGTCQMYYRLLSSSSFVKSVQQTPSPLFDGQETNYTMCRFDQNSILASFLRSGPTTFFDDLGHFTNESATCRSHSYLDKMLKVNSVGYDLVKTEGIEDASQNLRVVITDLHKEQDATFSFEKDGQKQNFTLLPGQKKEVFGYTVQLKEFGEKNVGLNETDNIFEPMASFTLSYSK